ncbi:hypothetical protein [Blastococcus sp. VKM Ac-2987]|nr:hypothetical protein [Blastococcus sp. VKM Ac-2987]MCZ2861226.1 hypothetical protein [Blastococcus sp. VKM Ac-2987]
MRGQDCPECRWVQVVDKAGRRRFEMRWQLPIAAPAAESLARAA